MLTQGEREAWLKTKTEFVGASEVSALFGVNPYMTPLRLWGLKTGRIKPEPENKYMRIGSAMEPLIASEYCLATGRTIYQDHWEPTRATDRFCVHRFGPMAMYSHADAPISCTPDRIINAIPFRGTDEPGACQLKWRATPFGDDWKEIDGVVQVPMATQMQVQMEIGILGMAWGSAAALIGGDLAYRDFLPSQKFLDAAMLKAAQFMHYVKHDQQPPDVTEDDRGTLCELYPEEVAGLVIALPDEAAIITERYELAKAAMDHNESIVEHCKAQLQSMLGEAEKGIVPGDGGAWTWKQRKAYEVKAHAVGATRVLRRTKK